MKKFGLSLLLGLIVASCGGGTPRATAQPARKLFTGCALPQKAPGERLIPYFMHEQRRDGSLSGLYFEVRDPHLAPAIEGNSTTAYRAHPISEAGAELVRRNAHGRQAPSRYPGLAESDRQAMSLVAFGSQPITFDAASGVGRSANRAVLPTDNLVFLDDGWAIGVIVPDEKVTLAQDFRASARAALGVLLHAQSGCEKDASGTGT